MKVLGAQVSVMIFNSPSMLNTQAAKEIIGIIYANAVQYDREDLSFMMDYVTAVEDNCHSLPSYSDIISDDHTKMSRCPSGTDKIYFESHLRVNPLSSSIYPNFPNYNVQALAILINVDIHRYKMREGGNE